MKDFKEWLSDYLIYFLIAFGVIGVIALTMLSFTLFGDGLRDALDPKMRR